LPDYTSINPVIRDKSSGPELGGGMVCAAVMVRWEKAKKKAKR
jgi:hypothetical protein